MPDKFSYEFVIIRVVPKVEREEFMNVGVIVFSKPKRYLDLKYHLDPERLKALSEDIDIATLEAHLQAWEDICAGSPRGGAIGEQDQPYRFRWLAAARSTILQTSRVHPGLCTDTTAVLEDLFRRYVGEVSDH
ncbi:MAG: DUF3037 domain-containing protein [Bacteroidota bacterium]